MKETGSNRASSGQSGGKPAFDDDRSPEAIRQKISVSKKAFKQALGKLYKTRRIQFLNPGIQLPDDSNWRLGGGELV